MAGDVPPRRLVFRRTVSGDADEVRRLRLLMLELAGEHFDADITEARISPAEHWDRWTHTDPNQVTVVADVGSHLVAMAAGTVAHGCVHVGAMWVDPAYRGEGVAAALLELVHHQARDIGVTCAKLGVSEANPVARRVYERAGYRLSGVSHVTRWGVRELEMICEL